jgi:CHASE2 domain-containing sensor protein
MKWLEYASTYTPENPEALSFYDQFRMWADDYRLYIIFVCLVAVYYMGFATRFRMPILKMVLLYVLLFIGAIIFTILDVRLPVKSALLLAIAILLLVRVRGKREKPGAE